MEKIKMLNEFGWKSVLLVFVVALCLSFGLVEGSWDSFEERDDSLEGIEEYLSNESIEVKAEEIEPFNDFNSENISLEDGDSFEYTPYFYIALGIGAVGLLMVMIFIYLFMRRPKNLWNKKRTSK